MGIGKAFEGALPQLHAHGQVHPNNRWIAVYFDDPATVPVAQLSAVGRPVRASLPVLEEYLNSPRDAAPADLLTDICVPLAEA
jgi:DNA gyrase inhibitor GyrI